MGNFQLKSNYDPAGDQPKAIDALVAGLKSGAQFQTLWGATGTGKTFTMANVIQAVQKPTLVLAHNKTLAAQLFSEFKEFFPDNAVEYFVSYYDYYQPEAYVPQRDLYIEKDSDINETIERYRSAATQALLTRSDVIIVASVSCIYGIGNPEDYLTLSRTLRVGESYDRDKLIRHLVDMQYERSSADFFTGMFRVRGDTVDVNVAANERAVRIEYYGNTIERLTVVHPISGEVLETPAELVIFPAKQFVTPFEKLKTVIPQIQKDLELQVKMFRDNKKDIEAMRLQQRVNFDLEMLQETGYCKGIENYSRYIERRQPGTAPSCLLDYYPDDWLLFIDESHMTLPQVRGMYNGDRARKQTLVDYGFRLQAAVDNRPLKYEEFRQRIRQVVFVSATPGEEELSLSKVATEPSMSINLTKVIEQVIRPTGLLDPEVEVRPVFPESLSTLQTQLKAANYDYMPVMREAAWDRTQVADLILEIESTVVKGQRVLVTTLTKKMSEELTAFLVEKGIKTQYIHSDIDSIQRVETLRQLRAGVYDVLVGINLLREGLDLPEVSLVAILDADKEGFLRSAVSLVQTIGRAARHEEGRVLMYADKLTDSMRTAIDETRRRRAIQSEYNLQHHIVPRSITKAISQDFQVPVDTDDQENERKYELTKRAESYKALKKPEQKRLLKELEMQMEVYADLLEFEKAAELRDVIAQLKN